MVLVLKKIVTIILCLLCAITASALSYASPYKGAGRNGYMHTSMHVHSSSSGLAQAPITSMSSTRSSFGSERDMYGGGAIPSTPMVRGITTSASSVRGGVTTYDSGTPLGPRKSPGGNPNGCHCEDLDGDGKCDHCHAPYDEFDGGCSNNPCWCPIEFDWRSMLYMAALAGAYALYKVRAGKKEIT